MPLSVLNPISVSQLDGGNSWRGVIGFPFTAFPTLDVALTSRNVGNPVGSRATANGNGPPNKDMRCNYLNLPNEAHGAAILLVSVECAGRRGGGQAGGTYAASQFDPAIGILTFTPNFMVPFTAPLPDNMKIQSFVIPFATDGSVWTQPLIDSNEWGLRQTVIASGVNVHWELVSVTWTGSGNDYYVLGASWLAPLILSGSLLAGMMGANLYHESPTRLAQIDKMIQHYNYDIGNKTVPTLSIREEREHMLKTLFVRPVFNI